MAQADSGRITQDFDSNWLFSKGDFATAMMPTFEDSNWRMLNVPHDWSIEGPFSPDFGSGNGFAPGGIGWYRKHFQVDPALKGKQVEIEFDGVYDNSEVWLNGHLVGGRPYGFESFQCDLTRYLKWGADNVLAVRVDHSRFADSRFYTGSGIYRNVRLSFTEPLHVAQWGTYVSTPKVGAKSATIHIETTIQNDTSSGKRFTVEYAIMSPVPDAGDAELTLSGSVSANSSKTVTGQASVDNPYLWSLDNPQLYQLDTRVKTGGGVTDETDTYFGVRTAVFDPDKGFLLNGVPTKLKGVCIHHDAGPLGAAVPDQVLKHRLTLLKEVGANAIRTSHNPPDPELPNLCDRLGFLVMDESFDEFTPGKNKWVSGWNKGVPTHFGYNEIFSQWGTTDLSDMVRRDRNHPCIVLWSIGNEVDYANDPFSDPILGAKYKPENPPATDLLKCAAPLVAAVKALDRTRPVTAALANITMSNAVGLPQLLDAVGYNYQEKLYPTDHAKYPRRVIYGSENSQRYADWMTVKNTPYISGEFIWTGIDYLGEAAAWPNRASGLGLFDLCGFKRPLAWFRQSLWSDKPMVYLCVSTGTATGNNEGNRHDFTGKETWNLPGGSTATVLCFTNCPEIALSLNGKALGTKKSSEAVNGILSWQVPYESGTLTAASGDGDRMVFATLKTAGPAARIALLPSTTQLHANSKDVSQIEYRVVDADGNRVPDADEEVSFKLSGPARMLGIGNGDIDNDELPQSDTHRAYEGRGLAILQATDKAGTITLEASAAGLEPASVTLQSQ
jgi:beta-galactosidase